MRRAIFPVALDGRDAAELATTRSELIALLGPAHQTGAPPEWPGPVDIWGYELEDGSPFVLSCDNTGFGPRGSFLACRPENVDRVVDALGLARSTVLWRAE